MLALIEWRTFEDGGRRLPPLGEGEPPYAAVVRFKDYVGPWPPEVAWNLVVRKMSAIGEYDWRADVTFKVDHAPHSELIPGREFELFEGHKCVAQGRLL